MNLPIPVVGVDPGPDYAANVNSSLTILDQHNHSLGSGVQITPSGLNINSALSLNGNTLTQTAAVTLIPQVAAPVNGSVYESGVDLFYIDGNGNVIQITSGGTVNATSSGITSGTASASFVAGVLVVNAAVNTPANIQAGSILLGNNVVNSKFLTLSPPNAMGANYQLVLPALPAQTNVMTLDTSGNMSSITYDAVGQNMTGVGSTSIGTKIAAGTLLGSQLANNTVTGSKIAALTVDGTNIVPSVSLTGNGVRANGVAVATANSIVSSVMGITRGSVSITGGVVGGEGFTATNPNTGEYIISFTNPYASDAVAVITPTQNLGPSAVVPYIASINNAGIQVIMSVQCSFSFIAIGLRP